MKVKSKSRNRRSKKLDLKINLPGDYAWKVLGWLTQDLGHLLNERELARLRKIIRNRSIDQYLALSEDWGLQRISLRAESLAKRRAKLQLAGLLKKFQFKTERDLRVSNAIKKFVAAEQTCRDYNLEGYKLLGCSETEWVQNVFTYARSFLQKVLGNDLPDYNVLTEWSRHGPGATLDTEHGLISTYHKYMNWPYSVTEGAFGYAQLLILNDPRWLGALEDSYRSHYGIPKWQILDWKVFWSSVLKVVPGNRITFVPKNAQTERSIAIEPTMNLCLQLGVDGFIRRRLKRWGVDLDSQLKNQVLAQTGSQTAGYDSFVTIDLSAASDTVSVKLCELLLPQSWYNYLMAIRSPQGELTDGQVFSYEKISSMGNGYTFALESSIFAALIYGVMKEVTDSFDQKDYAVFGDDLICRRSIVEYVIEILNYAGFAVNVEKSFFNGPVRESCGTDWFRGAPVRPVFFDEPPTDVRGLWCDINRLRRLLSLRWGVEDSITIKNLCKWIPEPFSKVRGPCSDMEFDSFLHCSTPPINARWDSGLWKYKRVFSRPRPMVGNELLFRKLMHNLRPSPPILSYMDGKLSDGSRFTVFRRKSELVGYTYSVSDIWRSTYAECEPAFNKGDHPMLTRMKALLSAFRIR